MRMPTASKTLTPAGQSAATGAARPRRPRRRRRFIVDARAQLKASLSSIVIVAGLLVVLNMSLLEMTTETVESIVAGAPELRPELERAARARTALAVACSMVLLIAFAALSFVESHRTFGAAHNLASRVREISSGRFGVRVRLRKNDTLQALASSVNEAAEKLEAGARAELTELERLHSIALRQGAPPELTRGIATLVERRRDLLS